MTAAFRVRATRLQVKDPWQSTIARRFVPPTQKKTGRARNRTKQFFLDRILLIDRAEIGKQN